MNMQDSKKIRNSVKVKSVIFAIIIHLVLASFTFGISLIVLLFTGLLTSTLLKQEINEATSNKNSFNKNFPFKYFGDVFGSFQHVFYYSERIDKKLYDSIEKDLKSKTPIQSFSEILINDSDEDLTTPESRKFIKAEFITTNRGTTVTLILNHTTFGEMQSINWRVLVGGYIDRDKKFNLVSSSIFKFFFWIIPYSKGEYDLLANVRTIYPASYNDMDVLTQVRCLHEVVFDSMINELETNGIDTSELKAQKMQALNISISGGKVSMGNIVQGAMNKIASVAKGVSHEQRRN